MVILLLSFHRKRHGTSFIPTWIPFTEERFETSLNEISPVLLMTIHLPFKKRCGFSFEQTYVPFTQGCFVPSLTEIGPVVLGKILKFRQMYLSYFKNYLCVEKGVALLLNEMNPLHPKMLCVKLGWNWPWGSWEDEMWSLQTDGQPENLTWAFS